MKAVLAATLAAGQQSGSIAAHHTIFGKLQNSKGSQAFLSVGSHGPSTWLGMNHDLWSGKDLEGFLHRHKQSNTNDQKGSNEQNKQMARAGGSISADNLTPSCASTSQSIQAALSFESY